MTEPWGSRPPVAPRDANPYDRVTAAVLHTRWDEGWTARAEEVCVRRPVDR